MAFGTLYKLLCLFQSRCRFIYLKLQAETDNKTVSLRTFPSIVQKPQDIKLKIFAMLAEALALRTPKLLARISFYRMNQNFSTHIRMLEYGCRTASAL